MLLASISCLRERVESGVSCGVNMLFVAFGGFVNKIGGAWWCLAVNLWFLEMSVGVRLVGVEPELELSWSWT